MFNKVRKILKLFNMKTLKISDFLTSIDVADEVQQEGHLSTFKAEALEKGGKKRKFYSLSFGNLSLIFTKNDGKELQKLNIDEVLNCLIRVDDEKKRETPTDYAIYVSYFANLSLLKS